MVNLSVASLTQIGLSLVLICWTTGSAGAAFSIEEEFLQLKENYIQMKELVKNLESKVTELGSKDAQMQEKVRELEGKIQHQDSLLSSLLREKNEHIKTDSDSAINQSVAVAINGLPSSCGDLRMIGHTLNGFYSIMGPAMMESVYCDFTKLPDDAGFQKWIGYADIKSAPVHFYVQRNSTLTASRTPIPFDLAVVNEGNAMNLTSGIFTAPRPGIYSFSFTGVALFQSALSDSYYLAVDLFLNGYQIGLGYVSEGNSTVDNQNSPLSLQSTLNLKKDDQVWVEIHMSSGVYLYDDIWHYTHFTGSMLEEEIVTSL